MHTFASWYRDLMLGIRALRRRPVFCLTAVLTLALGIGANTAIFTLLYGLFLRSLPVQDPVRLARILITGPGPASRVLTMPITWRMFQQLRRQQQSFTDLCAWTARGITMPDSEGTRVSTMRDW